MSEATQALLGSMIIDNECIAEVAEKVTLDMFLDHKDRQIWDAVISLNDSGTDVDLVTIRDRIGKGIADVQYLIAVCESMPSAASANHYAGVVIESHRKAEVASLAIDLKRIASNPGTADEMIVEADKAFRDRTEFDTNDEDDHIGEIASKITFKPDESCRIPTGIKAIDDWIIGIECADYVVIAGRPSMGKTALMCDIVAKMSWDRKIPVAFYTLEMTPTQIAKRMCSARCNVPLRRVEDPNAIALTEDRPYLLEAARQLNDCPMYIKSAGGLSPSKLRRLIANDKRKHNIQMAFVDHMHLMKADKPTGNPYVDRSSISREMKPIILDLGVPIILGCQLKRTDTPDPPKMTDIRGTGAIEEDADVIIGIHRPSYWTDDPDLEAWLYTLKGKHFGTGKSELEFHGDITSFCDKRY
jgi:replicative DNA helicase